MKVRLLYKDRKFRLSQTDTPVKQALKEDLGLEKIFEIMADGNKEILKIAESVLLDPLTTGEDILYRQDILKDCMAYPDTVRSLYQMLNEAVTCWKKNGWCFFSSNAENRFYGSVKTLQFYHGYLIRLRKIADENSDRFQSEGFKRLFEEIKQQLDDSFLQNSYSLLNELEFKDGMIMELKLGRDNRTSGYTLVRKNQKKFRMRWGFAPCYTLAGEDEAGEKDLSARCSQAYFKSVEILWEAANNIDDYLKSIKEETTFYIGALTLLEKMKERKIPYSFPDISKAMSRKYTDLRDLSLALQIEECVGNDLDTKEKSLYIITGANQGGKTTFLRSVGQAQLMFQSGLFVAASCASLPVSQGIFTHFKREEDDHMKKGKLEEELSRLDQMIPLLTSGSLLLFNESFSSTNEREGSRICIQITEALKDNQIEQFHVSHLYSFSHGFFEKNPEDVCFLRAERREDGSRSFRLTQGEPQKTAYGKDLFYSSI